MTPLCRSQWWRPILSAGIGLLWLLPGVTVGFAAESKTSIFDIPADTADRSLKLLSEQSGRDVLFPADAVEGVKTRPVKGEMPPEVALQSMLAGTILVGVQDLKTGALTVRRQIRPLDEKKKQSRSLTTKDVRP
jgi:hypothetical protein